MEIIFFESFKALSVGREQKRNTIPNCNNIADYGQIISNRESNSY